MTAGYRANPDNGEIAAELGRLALDMGRLDIAAQTLKVAEAQGVRDWKTLSAQGTLRAKQGQHAEAQQYYLAALQEQPDAVSVINNLALSYALDGKADKSEELLRKAVASGHDDKRVRQNLALVLGLQGKFEEARQVASVDMTDAGSQVEHVLSPQHAIEPDAVRRGQADGADDDAGDDWQPFAANDANGKSSKSADATPVAAPKVQTVKAAEKVEAPSAATPVKAAQAAPAATPAKLSKVAGTPTLITPVNATPAQVKAATPAQAAQGGTSVKAKAIPAAASANAAGLLRTDTD